MITLNLILFFLSMREVLKSRTKLAQLKSVTIEYKKTREFTAKRIILLLIFVMSVCKDYIQVCLICSQVALAVD